MNRSHPRPLPDTLTSLGVEELKERLEISPLLGVGDVQGPQLDNCCACKIPSDPAPTDSGGVDIGE